MCEQFFNAYPDIFIFFFIFGFLLQNERKSATKLNSFCAYFMCVCVCVFGGGTEQQRPATVACVCVSVCVRF